MMAVHSRLALLARCGGFDRDCAGMQACTCIVFVAHSYFSALTIGASLTLGAGPLDAVEISLWFDSVCMCIS